jgi:mRNA interferase MazF
MSAVPRRGEIWHTDFGTPVGHEAAFEHPAMVVSAGRFNAYGLITVLPITGTQKTYPTRIRIEPGISGLSKVSYIQVEQVRTISVDRLLTRRGQAEAGHLLDAERILRLLLELR